MELNILLVAIIVTAIAKAEADRLEETGEKGSTWQNKWQSPLKPSEKHWWYLGLHKPFFQEKFPFSSTLLVSATDDWHKWNTLRHVMQSVAISVYSPNPFLFFLGSLAVHNLIFQLYYNSIKE